MTQCLFVYGDNDVHRGKKGQAIIRDLPNTIGIPTKKIPSNEIHSFYTDDELENNTIKIRKAIDEIIDLSQHYEYIIFPEDGFGTGLAQLPIKAPKTYEFLNVMIEYIKNKI